MKNENQKDKKITLKIIIFSLILGILTNDILIGSTTLASGLLCAYHAVLGKKSNYLYGFINYLLLGYVAYKNHLYGIFFFYLFLFAPLQIKGFFQWKKNQKQNQLIIRNFNFQNSILIISGCLIGSILIGMLLKILPNQQIAFLDATSNCINLCGIILLIQGFKESWWLWFINNILDLIISIHCVLNQGENSKMMLITAISFLLMNIWGMIRWNQPEISK